VIPSSVAAQFQVCTLLLTAAHVFMHAGPVTAQQATLEERPPVTLGPAPELDLPEIQSFTLTNGLRVHVVELHALPVVQIDLVVLSGAAAEAPSSAGVADLAADMLDEGTLTRGALELAESLEYLGARLSTGAGWDASFVELHAPVARVDSAVALMAEVALQPAFPAEELARKRKERLTAFLLARDVPAALASVAQAAALYPGGHRYHARVGGTAETVARLGRQDLEDFYRRHYAPDNAALIVVGDVTAGDIRLRLEAVFGSWRARVQGRNPLANAPQVERTRIVLVDRPGSEQSEIRLVRLGPPRSTEDYVQLVVTNTLLGGTFSSRLNQNLREAHGYVYHAGSAFDFRAGPGPFMAGAAAQTAVTDSAVVEFLRELRRIRDERPADEEVEKAKRYVALSFPAEFETTTDVAARIAELVIYQLPGDFYDTFVEDVNGVTADDVQAAARSYLDPESVVIVVVGDAAKIRPGLERLGLGKIRQLSIDQVMGPQPKIEEADGAVDGGSP
jgi:zinc protease